MDDRPLTGYRKGRTTDRVQVDQKAAAKRAELTREPRGSVTGWLL